jgi:iron complex outermembrane receptor protein
VGVEVVATMTDPRDVSSTRTAKNDILPYRSKLITSPRVRFDWKRVRPTGVSGAGGQISALYQSSRYTDPGGLVIIDEQLTCELDGYLKWFDGLLTLRGRVSDLFDAKRTDIIGYPLPGRSVYFGIEAQY